MKVGPRAGNAAVGVGFGGERFVFLGITSALGFALQVLLCVSKAHWLDGAGTHLCPGRNGAGLGSSQRIV